ncbi:chemotaxis-specific protein-glutamate methyltransferase CheB [Actinomarinicola tropica]|uniref:Protein-glutamate methylesterase/protein-glutamine glutaminase n=1 Tax=Actinomarinicola tropica TaxID=2789776 RepID=A0A5Q2RS56_9ACTN|nr:chemotaxis-specific protein-glutamate methyltransferase CheB [Actinomarinicola tropica]
MPGRRARVLITDDAVVVRRLVSDVLDAVPTIDVVGTAPNGRIALQKIPQLAPDIVILDVEMPDMDGIQTLTAIREEHPDLPVVMFSTLTERGASITLEALMRGANDYVTKPANVGSVAEAMERVRAELVPRIHALCGVQEASAAPPARTSPLDARRIRRGALGADAPAATPAAAPPARPAAGGPAPRVDLVVIGVSTGGPNALAAMIPALPADLPVPVLVVQHMPPMFTRLLAERLDAHTPLQVAEAAGGEHLAAGRCWIAPGDRHLEVAADPAGGLRLVTHDGPRENSCRPAVDVLFRSAAATVGRHVLGVVMTGMGHDGLRGSDDLVGAGARVIAQDEATSVVWGMPGAVVEAGLAETVLPLDQIAGAIARRVAAGRVVGAAGGRS